MAWASLRFFCEHIYKKRTIIERLNSLIDNVFMFACHCITRIKKIKILAGRAFIVMLSVAPGRVRENKEELMRSLVRSTA